MHCTCRAPLCWGTQPVVQVLRQAGHVSLEEGQVHVHRVASNHPLARLWHMPLHKLQHLLLRLAQADSAVTHLHSVAWHGAFLAHNLSWRAKCDTLSSARVQAGLKGLLLLQLLILDDSDLH